MHLQSCPIPLVRFPEHGDVPSRLHGGSDLCPLYPTVHLFEPVGRLVPGLVVASLAIHDVMPVPALPMYPIRLDPEFLRQFLEELTLLFPSPVTAVGPDTPFEMCPVSPAHDSLSATLVSN